MKLCTTLAEIPRNNLALLPTVSMDGSLFGLKQLQYPLKVVVIVGFSEGYCSLLLL